MSYREKAKELFLSGANCSQSVLCAFCDITGLDFETSMKISSSFGGGMGRMREVCGACSGMLMAAGLILGYSELNPGEAKKEHYALVQELAGKFRQKNGSIICRELLAGSINTDSAPTPSERTAEYYKKRPCPEYAADAAGILEEYLKEKNII